MKKFITMIVLVFGITLTTQAQKDQLTVDQKTELKVKKMILKLDLTDAQVNQIKPLIREKVEERKAMHEKRKAFKEAGKKPTADERYAFQSKKLDKQIAFKKKMKNILNDEQYKKFEKFAAHKGKGKHGKKGKKGGECDKASCDKKE